MTRILAAAGLALGLAGAASAQGQGGNFLATNNLAGTNGFTFDGADQLISFNFGTAAWAPVSGDGGIRLASGQPVNGVSGLDYDHGTGKLYGATAFGNAATVGRLYEINPATGAATLIGQTMSATGAVVNLNDLSWDPVSKKMYGTAGSSLYEVALGSGAVTLVGAYSVAGMLEVGIGFDSKGHVHVHDLVNDAIYRGTAPGSTSVSLLHSIGYNSNFSQGLFVDWSTDVGYHGALNNTNLSSENYSYTLSGGSYALQSTFAIHTNGLPQVEVGDLTRLVPSPASLALLGLGGLVGLRRRR